MCIKHYSVEVVYLLTQSEWVVCSQYQKHCTTKIPENQIQKHGIADKPGKYLFAWSMEIMTVITVRVQILITLKSAVNGINQALSIYLFKENS